MLKYVRNQKGAFSPFMFGMLMGVAVFSSVMSHYAKRELEDTQSQRQLAIQEKAEDIRNALENAILTENIKGDNQFSNTTNLDRAQKFLTQSTGTTRSGEAAFLKETVKSGSFKTQTKTVVISTSDDELLQEELSTLAGSEAIKGLETEDTAGLVTFDSEAARQEQIKKSKRLLEMEASQIYRSYVTFGYKFPTAEEYKTVVNAQTGLKDVWGQTFDYNRKDNKTATLSFKTPWGYTFSKTLDMN